MDDLFAYAERRADDLPEGIPEDVCLLFERLALQVKARGHNRYSADAVLHQIRWHFNIERGDREFKANNDWTSVLARWFLAKHPELPKFFETRERKKEAA